MPRKAEKVAHHPSQRLRRLLTNVIGRCILEEGAREDLERCPVFPFLPCQSLRQRCSHPISGRLLQPPSHAVPCLNIDVAAAASEANTLGFYATGGKAAPAVRLSDPFSVRAAPPQRQSACSS